MRARVSMSHRAFVARVLDGVINRWFEGWCGKNLRPRGARYQRRCARPFHIRWPHGAIAIGDFALDDGGPQRPFASIVGRLDFGERTRDEQLVSRAGILAISSPFACAK